MSEENHEALRQNIGVRRSQLRHARGGCTGGDGAPRGSRKLEVGRSHGMRRVDRAMKRRARQSAWNAVAELTQAEGDAVLRG